MLVILTVGTLFWGGGKPSPDAPSKGGYFHQNVRNRFRYNQLAKWVK
ncbi:MAG: KTSC domain-containing protein [Acidobacteriota bacterium]|nr:KTSC domain-containing protein [Acidobacteriota bacterium]